MFDNSSTLIHNPTEADDIFRFLLGDITSTFLESTGLNDLAHGGAAVFRTCPACLTK